MGIDAFILVNITDYFFGLCDRLWGRPFIPGSKGSFSRHQDASLLSLEFRFKVVVFLCFSVLKASDGTWIVPFFPLGLEWPTALPTWEKLPLVASRLPSGDPAAHLSPWCTLSLSTLSAHPFLLLLQNSCVCPVGPLGLHIPRVFSYFTHWLTPCAPLSELSCILDSVPGCQRHVFNWTNQKNENSFGPYCFILITHPSREDGKECIL